MMGIDLRISGADDLHRVARKLREAGDKDLRAELYRSIQRATKPLRKKAQQAALADLPKRGGLNRFVADSKFSTRTRGGRDPGVKITAGKAGHDLRAIDRGRLRHPVFGNRRVWVTQQVKPGWFTETINSEADVVRREIIRAMNDIARKVR